METRKSILLGVLFSGLACLFGMPSCTHLPDEEQTRAALEKKGGMVMTLETDMPEDAAQIGAILQTRLDRFGAKKAFVKVSDENQIIALIPNVQEPERIRQLMQAEGRLEFWETYELYELLSYLKQINRALPTLPLDETIEDIRVAEYKQQNPLFGLLNAYITPDGQAMSGPAVGVVHYTDTARVMEMLTCEVAKQVLPPAVRFKWTVRPTDEEERLYTLVALKAMRDGSATLRGDVITEAKVAHNKWSPEPVIDITMNKEGTRCWRYMTMENIGKSIGIVVDGRLYSYPRVMCEIDGGKSQITGNFTEEEAADLANMLNSGVLPHPVRIIEEQMIEPNK